MIDGRALTRRCLSHWLEDTGADLRITPVVNAAELLDSAQLLKNVQLVVFSIGASRVADPEVVAEIGRLLERLEEIPLVVLGDQEEIEDIVDAVRRGVRGFIPTSMEPTEAAEAVRFVRAGGTFIPAGIVIRFLQQRRERPAGQGDSARFATLTPREMEVLHRLRHGKPNKVIARELRISESTVKVFVCRILTKLHATNRTEVAYLARQRFEEEDEGRPTARQPS